MTQPLCNLVRRGTRREDSPVCRRHVGAGVRHLAGLIHSKVPA